MSAFAKPTTGGHQFGVDGAKVAKRLRELAIKIERGDVHIENVVASTVAVKDEFAFAYLSLVFHEKAPKP